jgi:hypothetical protein
MLTIGMGKHRGCSALHSRGTNTFGSLIPDAARIVISRLNVPFAVAVVENAHKHIHTVRAVHGSEIMAVEKKLLVLAKELMPSLKFPRIDVLVVEEIGKDISGGGMDPNIVGRISTGSVPGYMGPCIGRIVVLGLSEESHGNAVGIGAADFALRSIAGKIDFEATYANAIASKDPEGVRLPVMFDTEEDALRAAIVTCPGADIDAPRVVKIKNTLSLSEIEVSESILNSVK